MHDALADMAYESAQDSFEIYRDKINGEAMDKHIASMDAEAEGRKDDAARLEAEAQALLTKARRLVYTGLMWQQDNGLMEVY